jgi:hypothetical protein
MVLDSECTKAGIRCGKGIWASSAACDVSCATISSPKNIDHCAEWAELCSAMQTILGLSPLQDSLLPKSYSSTRGVSK